MGNSGFKHLQAALWQPNYSPFTIHHTPILMQKDSKLFEDMARLASGAAGTLMDMKREVEAFVADAVERLIARERFVTREEFEVVKAMAQKAREENEALRKELESRQ